MTYTSLPFNRFLNLAGMLLFAATFAVAQSPTIREVLDLEEAATLLRVKPEVVSTLAEARRIPARRVGDEWRFSRAALLEWLKGDEVLATRGRGLPPVASDTQPAAKRDTDLQAPATVGERPSTPTTEDIALRDQRVLLNRGVATIDFDTAYARSQESLISAVRVEQSAVGASGTLRYGLAKDLQITTRFPAVWNRTASFTSSSIGGTNSALTLHDGYMGDSSVSLLGIGMHESTHRPTLVWSLDGVVPTGPGSSAAGGGLVFSKSYDPVVLFAGVNYLYGVSVHPEDPRSALAKQNVGVQVGYTYALNDNLALNAALVGMYRNLPASNSTVLAPARESYALQLGMTWLLAHNLFVEPAVAMNLGGDPGVTISLNFSRAFRWFNVE